MALSAADGGTQGKPLPSGQMMGADCTHLSLGWRTDLIFARFDGEVLPRGDHLVVRTPTNPGFWWGNFLLFHRAPVEGDAVRWLALFQAEIAGRQPESRHVAFGIDSTEPCALPVDFSEAGFSLGANTVLTLRPDQWHAPLAPLAAPFRVGRLDLPAQAPQAVDLQVTTDQGAHQPVADYRLFRERQMARYGAMSRAGLGDWFGVEAEGHGLVADCGLYTDGRIGRFQQVSTHPQWRRRGLCTALIHTVCRHGFQILGLDELVILADPEDVAIRLYEQIGFRRGSTAWQIERGPGWRLP